MSLQRRQAAASPQERLAQAKTHIQAKEYDKARRILKTIDHPTAKTWLQKLDNLAPEPAKTDRRRLYLFAVVVITLAVVVVAVVTSQMMGDAARQALTLTAP